MLSDLRYRLRALFRRDDVEQELDAELRFHLELEAEKLVKIGVPRDEAMRRARLAFGGVDRFKEESRDSRGLSWLETLAADLRYAARRLSAEPGFLLVTVLTLAIGIGGTTAIFSAVNPILLQPLPYPGAGRIVTIQELYQDDSRSDGTFGMYHGLAERARSFDAMAAFKSWQPTLTGVEQPERFDGQRVSASYFHVLGVHPAIGRDLQDADDQSNGPNVVVLGNDLWRRRFHGDSAIIGRPVTLNDNPHVVIGVMPAGFENVLAPTAQLWAPLQYDMTQGRAWGHHLRTIARLRAGIAIDQASREVDALGHAVVAEQHPQTYAPHFKLAALALRDEVTRGVRPALLAILGAVILVLVIACVNVTNLAVARGVRRRGEFAVRAALGASRGRLARQMLTESLLLAFLGGAAGIVVATLGVRALVALSPPDLPRLGSIRLNGAVLAFSLGLTTLIGLAFGLTPALQAARSDPNHELQHSSLRTVGGHRRIRGALVVVEVALALVLLVSSGLLLRSLQRLFAVDAGFDASRLLTMRVQTSASRFTDVAATTRFFDQAITAVQRVPGVTAVAFTSQLPMSGDVDAYGVHFETRSGEKVEGGSTFRYAVSPGYLAAMRIPTRHGRPLDEHDVAGAPLVAVLSESYAKRIYKSDDPIGQRLRIGPTEGPPYTVVGVVGDIRQQSLALSQSDAVYIPAAQWLFPDNAMTLVIRAQNDPAALAAAIRQAVWSVDRDQAIVRVATMESLLAATTAERRFALVLFEAFALAALILAAAGIYGVLSGSVAERTREIGVRAALGASRGTLVGHVVRQGLGLTMLGVAIGLGGAVAASQAMITMLFGVKPLDAVTFIGVIVLLLAVSLIACGLPAWRAARVDPASTLRQE